MVSGRVDTYRISEWCQGSDGEREGGGGVVTCDRLER